MVVAAAEFKANFGKYLELIAKEDICITRNGKTVAKVVNPQVSAVDTLRGMLGGISSSSDIDMDSLREERFPASLPGKSTTTPIPSSIP